MVCGSPRVTVVGGGVVGLTTANLLLRDCPEIQVRVVAQSLSPSTTSDVAAGIFYWGLQGPDPATTEKWARTSWEYFQELLSLATPWLTGVSLLPTLHMSAHTDITRPLMSKLCSVYRDLTPRELDLALPKGKYRFGKYFHTVQIDTPTYLAYLRREVEGRGGEVVQTSISSLQSLADSSCLVVNCSGLGARKLCGDTSLLPLRGQVLQVEAPWVKTALYCDDVYIIPGQKYVTVGGTRQHNDWMTEVSPHDSARIWARAVQTFPMLSGGRVLGAKVGLRPHRPTPRVELQMEGNLPVVHNYGHCGYGIMSSPGTSATAVELVQQWLRGGPARL